MTTLRAVLKLEWIGEGYSDSIQRVNDARAAGYDIAMPNWLTRYERQRRQFKPWVASVRALDETFTFAREFVRGQIDYSQARTSGNRGVYLYFMLKPGLYEVNAPQSWRHVKRYFCRVNDDLTMTELSREEVLACLPSQPPANLSNED